MTIRIPRTEGVWRSKVIEKVIEKNTRQEWKQQQVNHLQEVTAASIQFVRTE